ncbi:hypothetical protein ACP70R_034553 [Stipagrostis hirtigluma subsp. patula]
MASAVERREHSRRSRSPARDRDRRGTPPPRRRSPPSRRGSPARARSPAKASLSHRDRERSPARARSPVKASVSQRDRERSPPREKAKEQVRSPKHARDQSRSLSPARRRDSRSPSPRTKRLRRAQGEREVSEGDRGKAAHREVRDSGRRREHDDARDASRDRKGEREVAQGTEGDPRKASHKEERHSGRHREHDEGRDTSRDRKVDRDNGKDAAKDRKSDRHNGRDHSRDRKAGRDERSGASREGLSSRDDERHDSRGGRSDKEDRKAASSREQRVDRSDRRDSTRERMADREESNGGSGRSSRRGRSVSPEEHRHRGRHESHSSPRASRSTITRVEDVNLRGDEESQSRDADSVAMMKAAAEALEAKEKQKPSFELSGKLAQETNRVAVHTVIIIATAPIRCCKCYEAVSVDLLYSEPPEARKSDIRWRLYVFKGGEPLAGTTVRSSDELLPVWKRKLQISLQIIYPAANSMLFFNIGILVEKEQPDGMMAKKVRPYLMDLDSTNGTFINDNRIEPRRYYELFEKDTIKFGNSSREYVLLHENSAG